MGIRRLTYIFVFLMTSLLIFQLYQKFVIFSHENLYTRSFLPENVTTKKTIHIVYSCSPEQYVGLFASIRSLRQHATCEPTVHVFIRSDDPRTFDESVKVHIFKDEDVLPYVNKIFVQDKDHTNLSSLYNFVRFIIPGVMPNLQKVMWIDTDTIVQLDVCSFVDESLNDGKVLAAFPRNVNTFGRVEGIKVPPLPHFNAGIIILDVRRWNEQDCSRKIQKIVADNNKYKWWTSFGSQPPLNILFGGDQFHRLNPSLYLPNLGYTPVKGRENERKIFHWNGPKKPWEKNGTNKHLWERYN